MNDDDTTLHESIRDLTTAVRDLAEAVRAKPAAHGELPRSPDVHVVRLPKDIILVVATWLGVSVDDLLVGKGRSAMRARHVAMLMLRERGMSYPEIGRAVQRDHATVMSAIKSIKIAMQKDTELEALVRNVREILSE